MKIKTDTTNLSVIIPVFNTEKYLKECLDSILAQSFEDMEILCINDGSTDKSKKILKDYEDDNKNIRVITQENRGYGAAVNVGIREAAGKYISIIEPDDYIEPEMFKTLYVKACKYNLDVINGDYRNFYENGTEKVFRKVKVLQSHVEYGRLMNIETSESLMKQTFINPAGLYKRDFLLENDIFLNETPGASFQDRGFSFFTMLLASRVMIVDDPFYNYRRTNSASSTALGGNVLNKYLTEYRLMQKRLLDMKQPYEKYLQILLWKKFLSCIYVLQLAKENFRREMIYTISEEFGEHVNGNQFDTNLVPYAYKDIVLEFIRNPENICISIEGLKDEIKEKTKEHEHFIIYGAGVIGRQIADAMDDDTKNRCLGFAVSRKDENENEYKGIPIQELCFYKSMQDKTALIIGVSDKNKDEVIGYVSGFGFRNLIILNSVITRW